MLIYSHNRLEEEIARMKKNQERRLHRKNAKIVKEGGTPMQLNRPVKPDTTVRLLTPVISSLTHFVIRGVAGIAGKWVT